MVVVFAPGHSTRPPRLRVSVSINRLMAVRLQIYRKAAEIAEERKVADSLEIRI
jgi:hypothetical protein